MDNVEYVSRTCVVCGKAFTEVKHPKGNKRKFCSHECELAHRREYRRKYFRKRYDEDPEYREHLKETNAKYGTERRKASKENFMTGIVELLASTNDKTVIRETLEENFRVKSEKYDKYSKALRLPKESRS